MNAFAIQVPTPTGRVQLVDVRRRAIVRRDRPLPLTVDASGTLRIDP